MLLIKTDKIKFTGRKNGDAFIRNKKIKDLEKPVLIVKEKRQQQAKILRISRKIHRITGASLFIFFFFLSITGLLLAWKKHSGGIILAKSIKGTSTDLKDWLSIDSLHKNARAVLHDSVSKTLSTKVERMDIRKNKGVVKFSFSNHYWGVQLDGATGKCLQIERRRSDLIENIHDGSIIDTFFGTTKGQFKLIYSTIMGMALLSFTVTGFWLWYGPKRMREKKKRYSAN